MARGDVAAKCTAVSRALKIIEEGLETGLDKIDGGELASNLEALYDYATHTLIMANARNDDALFQEVQRLIETIADGWKMIKAPAPGAVKAQETQAPRLSLVEA
jgi:flagellar protein FliS